MYEVTPNCGQIHLGKQGENSAKLIYFAEPSLWQKVFGEGRCELIHQRCGDAAPYPVALEGEGVNVYWKVSAADTAIPGNGKCELRYIVGDTVVKSTVWVTTVLPALEEATAEVPEPSKSWVDQVLAAAAEIQKLAEDLKGATLPKPTIGYVTLLASKWVGDASPYSQVVTVDGATKYSQVDLTPDAEQLAIFHNKDLAFVTENEGGVITVYAIGQKPTNDYTIQATITEVSV